MIELRNVAKEYRAGAGGTRTMALSGASLDVAEGEFIALMGPSGSGKSTLLSILGGLNPPTSGEVTIDTIPVYQLSQERLADFRREYIGFVFQQFQLIPYLTALENVMLPLAITRKKQDEQRELAEAVLTRVGLAGKHDRLPNQLSGGEQERVAIARAIVNDPPVLLADEPTGALDTRTSEEIMDLFRFLNQDGLTIVMVTHNRENARYAGKTVEIRDGSITSSSG
ncbi:MAG: ABC transporter ATP-binding protein [Firmicutes bacterium]|nr:ABC transporter ATP-binding protein [Bacillota bacterium]